MYRHSSNVIDSIKKNRNKKLCKLICHLANMGSLTSKEFFFKSSKKYIAHHRLHEIGNKNNVKITAAKCQTCQ